MPKFPIIAATLIIVLAACGDGRSSLCKRTFEPYPDLISGRVITDANRTLLNGMELYRTGDHARAADSLKAFLSVRGANKAAYLYLANSYLALGQPFNAELQLDHLRNSNLEHYRDQWEWYTVVCWVCSDQHGRALEGAQRIAQARRHTYQQQAERLAKDLRDGKR